MTQPEVKPPLNEGIDVSGWQSGINWQSVIEAGKTFAYIKSGEGLYHDNAFAEHWRGAKEAGVLRGAYHYFRASVDPLRQAEQFAAHIRDGVSGDWYCGELKPAIDVEFNAGVGHDEDADIPPVEWARRLKIMIEALEHDLKIQPIIYTSFYMWGQYVDPTGDQQWARNYDLWCAHYGVPTPFIPRNRLGYVFHQYGQCLIDGANIDANRFNETNIFDYAQILHIRKTKEINKAIEILNQKKSLI